MGLLCEPGINVGVDPGNTPGWVNGDSRRFMVTNLGEGCHVGVYNSRINYW